MARIVYDLSMPLDPRAGHPQPPQIQYGDHREGAGRQAGRIGLQPDDMPDGLGSAAEVVTTRTHAGTHMDAPWHYYPTSGGEPARRIDQVPLEWCISDGVVLDVRDKPAGYAITPSDLEAELARIGYQLEPLDIVLIRTGADARYYDPGYADSHPGMSAAAMRWLVERGIRVIGVDAYSVDTPWLVQRDEYRQTGRNEVFWAAHRVGKEAEFCIVEQLGNLGQLPRPFGFTVCIFPVKVKDASGAWARAVAIFEEE